MMQIKLIIYNKAPLFSIIFLIPRLLLRNTQKMELPLSFTLRISTLITILKLRNMNTCFYRLAVPFMLLLSLSLHSCINPCNPNNNADVGDEFFTVTYQDGSGTNYLDIYNPSGIVVFLDSTGGESSSPKFELITPGYADGKFGPFFFTEKFVDIASNEINLPLLFERPLRFDYYIKKDTYGQDTISVEFLLEVDECNYNWAYINYFQNGNPLPLYDGQTGANIVIVE